MSLNSFTFAVGALNYGEGSLVVENNDLVSVCLTPERTGTGNAEYWGELFLASTDTPLPLPIAFLASGYFGASHYIGWTGRIAMQPTYAIYARIWCENPIPVRCSVLTE